MQTREKESRGFAFSRDLLLYLFPKLQGISNSLERFGCSANPAHDDRPIAQDSSQRRLLDRNALDSRKQKLDRPAIRKTCFYDDSLIRNTHFCRAALEKADSREQRRERETKHGSQIHRRSRNGALGIRKTRNEDHDSQQRKENGADEMSRHDDPMELGLVLNGFARDKMLLDVTQSGSRNA